MPTAPTVFLVDDDPAIRDALSLFLEAEGLRCEAFDSAGSFLDRCDPQRPGCLVLDVRMPGMSGLDLQAALVDRAIRLPIIFLSGHGDVPMSVRAMRAGAVDFMEKPCDETALLERIREAIERDRLHREALARQENARRRVAQLTPREREVMLAVVAGRSNKQIAKDLQLSHRTVEVHRARLMEKTRVRSLTELIELAVSAGLRELSG